MEKKPNLVKHWTDNEDKIITKWYPETPRIILEMILPERSWLQICRHAVRLGVSRSKGKYLLRGSIPEREFMYKWIIETLREHGSMRFRDFTFMLKADISNHDPSIPSYVIRDGLGSRTLLHYLKCLRRLGKIDYETQSLGVASRWHLKE